MHQQLLGESVIPKTARFAIAWLVGALIILFGTRRAEAAPHGVIELDVDANEAPTTMCLIGRRIQDGLPLADFREMYKRADVKSWRAEWDQRRAAPTNAAVSPRSAAKSGKHVKKDLPTTRDEKIDYVVGAGNMIFDAVEAFGASAVFAKQSCEGTPCTPREELDDDSLAKRNIKSVHVYCRSNSNHGKKDRQREWGPGRLALIWVDFHGLVEDQPGWEIVAPYFEGSVISFQTEAPFPFFTARIVGGDFLREVKDAISVPEPNDYSRARITASPRCVKRSVLLPQGWTGETRLNAGDESGARCAYNVDAKPNVPETLYVPTGSLSGRKSVLATRPFDPLSTAEFRWTENIVPLTLQLQFTQLGFRWVQHCLYSEPAGRSSPQELCPAVESENMRCEPFARRKKGSAATCEYRCKASSNVRLPTNVRFRRPDDRQVSWTDELQRHNEELTSYLARDDRHILVDTSKWVHRGGWFVNDTVDHIEIDVDGGKTFLVGTDTQRIAAPGLECNTGVRYKFFGDRGYEGRRVTVETERLVVPNPEDSVENIIFKVSLGGGAGIPLGRTADLDGSPRPEKWGFGLVMIGLSYRGAGWPMSIDLQGGYMLAEREYFPLTIDSLSARRDSVLFTRGPIQAGISLYPWRAVALGLGGMTVFEQAAVPSDEHLAGEANFAWGGYADARVKLARGFWLALAGRVLANEQLYWHRFEQAGGTERVAGATVSIAPSLELRGEWGLGRVSFVDPEGGGRRVQ